MAIGIASEGCLRGFLRHGVPGNCTLEAVEVEPPKLQKGENVIDGVERLRRDWRMGTARIHTIQSASYPPHHTKPKMRVHIERLAERGAISVSRLVEIDGEIEWPTVRVQSEVSRGAAVTRLS